MQITERTIAERVATARAAVDYLTTRTAAEQAQPVPNCPGWTVRGAAVHVCRVSIAWESMMKAAATDADSRARGYEISAARPEGVSMPELASWAHSALDQAATEPALPCYHSMSGGPGDTALWAWHSASEIGVHQMDVEAALGHRHAITTDEGVDGALYVATFVSNALRAHSGEDPGSLQLELLDGDGGLVGRLEVSSSVAASATVRGPAEHIMGALWGRRSPTVEVVGGDEQVWSRWQDLPGKAFQFGTWD
ncbi:MAG: hypothetical protein ACI8Y4_002238 [Candidatus Poriferisodalaceae bacterium]|jgi:uncharacterized protein (TIGR03083 family)